MRAHYLIMADRGHLRIYVESRIAGHKIPELELVEAVDFPADAPRAAADEDSSGHPFSVDHSGFGTGASPLATSREMLQSIAAQIGGKITSFLRSHLDATWDFATSIGYHQPVLDHVASSVRRRLRQTLGKDLSRTPLGSSRNPFSGFVVR